MANGQANLIDGLDPVFRTVALQHQRRVIGRGVSFAFRSTRRSVAEQATLFETLEPGQAAPPGKSLHEIGFAYDIVGPTNSTQWDIAGSEGKALGLRWGGDFQTVREPWHFQAPITRTELRQQQIIRGVAIVAIFAMVAFAVTKGL